MYTWIQRRPLKIAEMLVVQRAQPMKCLFHKGQVESKVRSQPNEIKLAGETFLLVKRRGLCHQNSTSHSTFDEIYTTW